MCSSVLYEEAWQRVQKLRKKLLIIAPHIMNKKRIPVELVSLPPLVCVALPCMRRLGNLQKWRKESLIAAPQILKKVLVK